jgi:hypothetical protein
MWHAPATANPPNHPALPQIGRDDVKIGPPDGCIPIDVRGQLAQRETGVKADEHYAPGET